MSGKEPLRVALIGPGKRSHSLYGPLIKALPGFEQLKSLIVSPRTSPGN